MQKILILLSILTLLVSCGTKKTEITTLDPISSDKINKYLEDEKYKDMSESEKLEVDFERYSEKDLKDLNNNFKKYKEIRIKEIEEIISGAPDNVDKAELENYRKDELKKLDEEYKEILKIQKNKLKSEYEIGVNNLIEKDIK